MQVMAKPRDPMDLLIHKNLVKFIEESGYSLNVVADLSGITQASLGRYVRGENDPPASALKPIADALGRTVDDFYQDNPPPPKADKDDLFFRSRPDAVLSEEIMKEVREFLAKKNAELRDLKKKQTKKK